MRLPATIGKYRIEEFLGGGMAEVYRAEDTVLGRQVAFKQLSPAGMSDHQVRTRFLEEAKVGGQLTHDNIVRTFDYGEEGGQPFIVMELLTGLSLGAHIKAGDLGDFGQRARIALEMARALHYLHSHKILHRDIKPDNVHIDAINGRVRLLDFGIAKAEGMNLTMAGFVVGTPFYMAPEQLNGTPVGPATDIYAFGLVVFEMLTGKKARPAETVERVLQQILNDPVDHAPLEAAQVPEALASIVRSATQADPLRRPASFATVIAQLENYIEPESRPQTQAEAATAPSHRYRMTFGHGAAMAMIAATIGGLAVGLLGVSLARGRMPEQLSPALTIHRDERVAIPGGHFEFEQQRHKVYLGPFEIDRTEVTNERYAMFCRVTKHPVPVDFHEDWPGQPVTGVTIDDARAYCFAQSKHLPTEMQWERAARGSAGARFPWGVTADATRANLDSDHLVSVESMKLGASAEGVLHLIGNAAEWVDQPRSPSVLAMDRFGGLLNPPATENESWYIIKGGSFRRTIAESAADLWLPAPGRYSADDVGFRCAR